MKNRKQYLQYNANHKKWSLYGHWFQMICPNCGSNKGYYYWKYDASCCPICDTWLEKACNDPNCTYCAMRPQTPAEALFLESDMDIWEKDRCVQNYQHKNDGKLRHMRKRELYAKVNERHFGE